MAKITRADEQTVDGALRSDFHATQHEMILDAKQTILKRQCIELGLSWTCEPHVMILDEQVRTGCRIGSDYTSPIGDHRLEEYLDLGTQQVTR